MLVRERKLNENAVPAAQKTAYGWQYFILQVRDGLHGTIAGGMAFAGAKGWCIYGKFGRQRDVV